MSVIKLDYDGDGWEELARKRLGLVRDILGLWAESVRYYESKGGNHHVVVVFREEFSDLEVLCLQLILGSDYVRECYNLRRIWSGVHGWNVLYLPRREIL